MQQNVVFQTLLRHSAGKLSFCMILMQQRVAIRSVIHLYLDYLICNFMADAEICPIH